MSIRRLRPMCIRGGGEAERKAAKPRPLCGRRLKELNSRCLSRLLAGPSVQCGKRQSDLQWSSVACFQTTAAAAAAAATTTTAAAAAAAATTTAAAAATTTTTTAAAATTTAAVVVCCSSFRQEAEFRFEGKPSCHLRRPPIVFLLVLLPLDVASRQEV